MGGVVYGRQLEFIENLCCAHCNRCENEKLINLSIQLVKG